MAQALVMFRESTSFTPWGNQSRASSRRSSLPDATEKYSSCTGSISFVNKLLSKQGLQYPISSSQKLPPLVSKPLTAQGTTANLLGGNKLMASKRKRKKTSESASCLPPPSEESKLVELASFPGFDPDHPTPLPHGLDTIAQMQRTQRAQAMLSSKRQGFRDVWKRLFYSPHSQAIVQDYFWWFFLHKFQNSKLLSVQAQLFARISTSYVSLICEDVDNKWKDAFFKPYPDLVAQCVYSTFVHAYPASWSSFDAGFRSSLITIMSLWQVGTRPLYTAWKKWNLDVLEPTNHLKHLSEETSDAEVSSSKPPKKTAFELDALLRQCEAELMPTLESHNPDDPLPLARSRTRHISPSNFESVLATSKATNELIISPSSEELVKSQAQATRDATTDVTTRLHEPCLIRSPSKLNPETALALKRRLEAAHLLATGHYPPGSGEVLDIPVGTLEGGQEIEIFVADDDCPQEDIDEVLRQATTDRTKIVVQTSERIDNLEDLLNLYTPEIYPVDDETQQLTAPPAHLHSSSQPGSSETGSTTQISRYTEEIVTNASREGRPPQLITTPVLIHTSQTIGSSPLRIAPNARPSSQLSPPQAKSQLSPPQAESQISPPQTESQISPPQTEPQISPPQARSQLSLPQTKSKKKKRSRSPRKKSRSRSPRPGSPKTAPPVLETAASCMAKIGTVSPSKMEPEFEKPSSPQPHRKKPEAQDSEKPPPLPPKRSKRQLPPKAESKPGAATLTREKATGQEAKPGPAQQEIQPASALWKQRALTSLLPHMKTKPEPVARPPPAYPAPARPPPAYPGPARPPPAYHAPARPTEPQVPVPIAPLSFDHVQFNTLGHSPLVKHFLREKQLCRENETKVLTGRTELVEETEPVSVSYQDLLCEAYEKAVKIYEKIEDVCQAAKRDMAKASKDRVKMSKKSKEDLQLVLTAKNEVKQLSNVITDLITREHDPAHRRENIATAIDDIITRLNSITF